MLLIKRPLAYWAISSVIIVILGTQTIAVVFSTGRWGWPIINYDLYVTPRYDGQRLEHDPVVSAVLEDLTEIKIDRDELHLGFWIFNESVVRPIREKKALHRLKPIVDKYCSRYANRIVALTVQDLGIAITRDGPVAGLPPIELGRIDMPCGRGALE